MEEEKQTAEAYIAFELAGTTYAVPSSVVQQVEMIEQITPVPNAPPAVEGIGGIGLRGITRPSRTKWVSGRPLATKRLNGCK